MFKTLRDDGVGNWNWNWNWKIRGWCYLFLCGGVFTNKMAMWGKDDIREVGKYSST